MFAEKFITVDEFEREAIHDETGWDDKSPHSGCLALVRSLL